MFHRQLKAAVMCYEGTTWLEALPLILLRMRCVFKPDIQTSPAELVYGIPLSLPRDMVTTSKTEISTEDIANFVTRIVQHMAKLRPTLAPDHTNKKVFIFQDLKTSTHVFLRNDTVRKSLQPPYSGPYKVIDRSDKTFTIQKATQNIKASIDRVKPAYML
ncbi:uncharacterized protein LOC113389018 [Ctenocephalides felis]|uniref:uncharacterized protein LOC113389018 n=1 Tax=Ctenocephalides felis TaxID=7515 RepID=UPI000E6E3EB4|nr:uncharacterized protein LOC113389018 [Ctenocephalides felis]